MEHKLVIHVGTPKTGTTAIQQFLCLNSVMLQQFGWYYLDLQRGTDIKSNTEEVDFTGAKLLSKVVDLKSGWCVDTEHTIWREMWKLLKGLLRESDVILSEEMIWRWNMTSFFEACKREYDNIEVIVYLRRQDRYIESWWNQEVKERPFRSEAFDAYIKNNKDATLHYLERLNKLSSTIGKERVKVRAYEKKQFLGARKDVISDFLATISVFPNWEDCIINTSENEGLYGNVLEIKRNLNAVLVKEDAVARQVQLAFRAINATHGTKTSIRHIEGYFSPDQRVEFLNRFSEENDEIARKYLNQKKLFLDENLEIPEYKTDWSTMYADLIRIFGQFVYRQQKTLYTHANLMMYMLQKSLLKAGRRLAIFGAGFGCRNLLAQFQISVDVIWDNDVHKHGKFIQGIPIKALDCEHITDYFIIISCESEQLVLQISDQLEGLGCRKNEDYIVGIELL